MKEDNPLEKRWLSQKDLLKEFGIGISNQAKLRNLKKIPFSRVGRYIRYDRIEINLWLENNKVEVKA